MKLSERLRKLDQPQSAWPVMPDGTPLARQAADLLEECEQLIRIGVEVIDDEFAEGVGRWRDDAKIILARLRT